MKLLSIDPAGLTKHSGFHGYAIFDNGKLISSGIVDFRKMSELEQIKKMGDLIFDNKIEIMVIEHQFKGCNVQSMIRVIEGRRTWEVLAISQNCKKVRYQPSDWQSAMLGRTKPRDTVKKLSVLRVKGVYKKLVGSDEADAINIGEYYLKKLGG